MDERDNLRRRARELEQFKCEHGSYELWQRLWRLIDGSPEADATRYVGRLNVDLLNTRTVIVLLLLLEGSVIVDKEKVSND